MNKELKINLNSQREIQQEGTQKYYAARDIASLPIVRDRKSTRLNSSHW